MVCTGNICRSPTADGVMRKIVGQAGLAHRVRIDSAGTTDYHVGEAPDRRAQLHAKKRGYDLGFLRAREVKISDFSQFDLILAMDKSHLRSLQHQCPPGMQHKIQLFLDFANKHPEDEVPDPYYGGADGFEHVLDLVEDGCEGLLSFTIDQLNN
ncbi:low molecular weight phosphotyrosine protein phosphatase [Chitinibacter bivalviorum]|uniref:Low molecular weight phosphotyrosine protein phosphatase n=1 Tax=Chitinibacter bivalviorum TaxID=2739434 RepID=A0A7H9BMX6_9NEIS|nr:low molecular weight protein-tyrosine-phosphatase [Chitinibacter bivalviorum]QLG89829.1 low molecular weight phosphotyrosine protein phosphatase [Chitinibacter bivalviorum]